MKQLFLAIIAIFTLLIPQPAFASTNDFYFKDAVFDYYLENSDSGNTMHVKETLTAVFPETDQNHGITRAIPFTNMNGKNRTVESTQALNLKVTRNGKTEPVSKITQDEDEYIIYIGSAGEYVHGEQTYTLEYDFKNVITEFSSTGENITGADPASVAYQELYWDTNGTGWSQKFEHLTANLHLTTEQSKALIGDKTSCYVGRYGTSGSQRCNITSADETTYSASSTNSSSAISTTASAANTAETILSLETSSLAARENLTFAVDFSPDTFTAPAPVKNYLLVIIAAVVFTICAIIVGLLLLLYFKKARAKRKYYKALFTAPQYTPLENIDTAEAAQLHFSKAHNPYVATLLELAVSGKISIIKGEPTKILKKDTWSIKINDKTNLTNSQFDLLKLLSGDQDFDKLTDDTFTVKRHEATAELEKHAKNYKKDAVASLKKHGYFEESAKAKMLESTDSNSGTKKVVFTTLAILIGIYLFSGFVGGILSALGPIFDNLKYGQVVGEHILPPLIVLMIIATIIGAIIIGRRGFKYKKFTEKGLDAANYLDGLYLYIKMAEADRLKFLQSVKGADTSAEGIVKLYEKLLPYACLFGLEESWLAAFGRYCQEINYTPNWYAGDEFITYYALSNMTRSVNSYAAASSSYSSSDSGGSSFSSGGGGGGFSGGGGGGGGGGGW